MLMPHIALASGFGVAHVHAYVKYPSSRVAETCLHQVLVA